MSNEVRKHQTPATEIRASENGKERVLEGYAAVFNSLTAPGNLPGFREKIAPGAFSKVLASNPDCRMLINHDGDQLLGRTKSGTLTLSQDSKGLRFRCVLPDTTQARDVYELVKRGDMSGCSFAFSCDSDQWDTDEDGGNIRTVRNVADLLDCSVVTTPAYDDTSVDARGRKTSDDEWRTLAAMRLRLASATL
jgi:HK97 family phage prohead protease